MNFGDLRHPVRVAGGLVLFVYFLSVLSCGQDPAFRETQFGNGQASYESEGSGANSADALSGTTGGEDGDGKNLSTSSGDDGSKDGSNHSNPDLPELPVEVVELCSVYERKVHEVVLNFPEREDCSWNQNGNLGKRNEYMQAREAQSRDFVLPEDSVLCTLDVQSELSSLHYDDFLFFTMNDRILMGSNSHFVEMMNQEGNVYTWDWNKIKGSPWSSKPAYCLEGSENCEIPPHDVPGAVNLQLNEETLSEIAVKIIEEDNVRFSLISTGDNDNGDCFHSEVNLNMRVEYISLP